MSGWYDLYKKENFAILAWRQRSRDEGAPQELQEKCFEDYPIYFVTGKELPMQKLTTFCLIFLISSLRLRCFEAMHTAHANS